MYIYVYIYKKYFWEDTKKKKTTDDSDCVWRWEPRQEGGGKEAFRY